MNVFPKKFKNASPQVRGFYSINSNREYDESASSLRYLKMPSESDLPIDLNDGIHQIMFKPESYFDEKMDRILTYIVNNKSDFVSHEMGSALIPSAKYITYRGVLKLIMLSQYEKRNGWSILATKYKNNIYMCQSTKEEYRDAFTSKPFSIRRFAYYGPKFKQCCTTEDPSKTPDKSRQIEAYTQFFAVFERMLIGRDFLFAGDIDAVQSDVPLDLNRRDELNTVKFVGLKICENFLNSWYLQNSFRITIKLATVWAQSYLSGIKDNLFGLRNKDGILNGISYFSTEELLGRVTNHFDPAKCFEFLDEFFKMVDDKMDNIDCPHTVLKFNYDETDGQITCTTYEGKTELSLLPDWYLDAVNP